MTQAEAGRHARAMDGALWAKRAAAASCMTAATLVGLKAAAWIISDSVAILSALADSGIDLAASIGALIALLYAQRPSDDDHRFGHDKAEAVAGLLQGAAMLVSAAFVLFESARGLWRPIVIAPSAFPVAVAVVSMAATVALTAFQGFAVRRSGSLVVEADRRHYLGDLILHLGVIASFSAAAFAGVSRVDPAFGLLAAAWLAWSARQVLRTALDQLMDRELDARTREDICAIAESTPGAHRVRALRTRMAGARPHMAFHVEMDPDITLLMSHHIALEIERRLKVAFPGAEVFIHPDPLGWADDHPEAMALDDLPTQSAA